MRKNKKTIKPKIEEKVFEIQPEEETENVELSLSENETIESFEGFTDDFEIECDDNDETISSNIVSVDLAKLHVNILNNVPNVERSPILLTLKDNMNVCARLLQLSTKKLKTFKIKIMHSKEKNDHSNWTLENVLIKGIDFGLISSMPQEQKRVIQCELEYEKLNIDGVKL